MILYPTETIYALGVNALDERKLLDLEEFKGRSDDKSLSWLVRNKNDIAHYAYLNDKAVKLIDKLLPGPLTLVLTAKETIPAMASKNGTIGFRISSDPTAQALIADYMNEYNAPLTCTSANVSGEEPADTPEAILEQFTNNQKDFTGVTKILDDGKRNNLHSTVVRVAGDELTILREGSVSKEVVFSCLD